MRVPDYLSLLLSKQLLPVRELGKRTKLTSGLPMLILRKICIQPRVAE